MDYIVVFIVSLLCISLELFLTRILNLKAWNHVVYVIIPFAILGYGIGANICLVFRNYFLNKWKDHNLIGFSLVIISFLSLACSLILVNLPINISFLLNFLVNAKAMGMLLLAYTILMIPFVFIGFVVVYVFLRTPEVSHKLYFFDLLGASLGAFLFYPLINSMQIFHSLILLCSMTLICGLIFLRNRLRILMVSCVICLVWLAFTTIPEPKDYTIDKAKGWEWIPGHFQNDQYQQIVSRWHPMGRTDIFRIVGVEAAQKIYHDSVGTFELNVSPLPEFSYVSTNFLSGTPIYKLSSEGLAEKNSHIIPFSVAMEFPYTVSGKNKVLIIGAGGGRDIFMAKSHGVKEIIGAEINPGVYTEMSAGGAFYLYSGRVYTLDATRIFNLDGRQLVKRQPTNTIDLIILNGVDTFSGLSTGAYAYAESYLYTKEAMIDYLRVLNNDGMINFNRWFDPYPREDLRLFAIALDALRTINVKNPGDHIIIGSHQRWALMLIKKTPFTDKERTIIKNYFATHDTSLIYPTGQVGIPEVLKNPSDFYNLYLENFKQNNEGFFSKIYRYDVSVVTDNNPFFYKYYKLSSFNPLKVFAYHHTGTVIFMTQGLVFIQALIFILLFIFVPLVIFKKNVIKILPLKAIPSFIVFFSCLGVGFMFIEIPLMQRFVLLLGSPIYSLSVTLTFLLLGTGLGSLLLPQLQKLGKNKKDSLSIVGLLIVLMLAIFVLSGVRSLDPFVGLPLAKQIMIVASILLPLGILLGVFFPSGLELVSKNYQETIAWAWGINAGFSVLGSILAIILAQFLGFHMILLMGGIIYLIAVLAFRQMVELNLG